MSTDISPQLAAYHAFVKTTLSNGGSIDEEATPAAFLEHQRQLDRLRAELQPAIQRFQEGELGVEVDIDELVEQVLRGNLSQEEAC